MLHYFFTFSLGFGSSLALKNIHMFKFMHFCKNAVCGFSRQKSSFLKWDLHYISKFNYIHFMKEKPHFLWKIIFFHTLTSMRHGLIISKWVETFPISFSRNCQLFGVSHRKDSKVDFFLPPYNQSLYFWANATPALIFF